ncbi:MAG TPA: phosphoribulokinase [Pseudonocardiaceae bacterium]
MVEKTVRMARATHTGARPVMLAIAGDSASGKTTLTKGLMEALGPESCVAICVDDYHRYDRLERKNKPFTAIHPDCNYIDIMTDHLHALAMGKPILKPVYDHDTGMLTRPEYVEPRQFVIIEGLLPLYTKALRACFDVTVFLDPPEEIRYQWKIQRDTQKRGYNEEQVLAELARRGPESTQFIRPQRGHADVVVRFAPVAGREDPPSTPLSAELMLRPTIHHPDLSDVVASCTGRAIHLKLDRDEGRPVDALHVHGYAPAEDSATVQKAIWSKFSARGGLPETLGMLANGTRSEPLAITQLIVLYHLLDNAQAAS